MTDILFEKTQAIQLETAVLKATLAELTAQVEEIERTTELTPSKTHVN